MAENLAQDMSDLMHDYEVVSRYELSQYLDTGSIITLLSRMNSMIGTLKCSYPSLTSDTMTEIMDNIQKSIRQKVNSLKD